MKPLFWTLLLLNVLAFGFIQFVDGGAAPAARSARQEIDPDKITLLHLDAFPLPIQRAPESTPAAPVAAAGPSRPPTCLEWGGFDAPSARRAVERLATLGLDDRLAERQDPVRHWVFIPPLGRSDAHRKLDELKGLGVRDVHITRNYAISLGLFSSEERANRRLAQLSKLGVGSAVMAPLDGSPEHTFVLRDVDEATASRIAAWAPDFPGASLTTAACFNSLTAETPGG